MVLLHLHRIATVMIILGFMLWNCFWGKLEYEINLLRQDLLSCTAENKSKREFLKDYYTSFNRIEDYNKVIASVDNNVVLSEIMVALENE